MEGRFVAVSYVVWIIGVTGLMKIWKWINDLLGGCNTVTQSVRSGDSSVSIQSGGDITVATDDDNVVIQVNGKVVVNGVDVTDIVKSKQKS